MNDAHDNEATDREMLKRYSAAPPVAYYRAVIETNGRGSVDEDNAAMLRMELTFAIGRDMPVKPEALMKSLLAGLNLSLYMTVVSVAEIDAAECEGLGTAPGSPATETCEVCHDRHMPQHFGQAGDVLLIPGHEYVITTLTRRQQYSREWRMGFLSRTSQGLVFTCRGPERSHSKQYAGNVTIHPADITDVREVTKDVAKRHVGRQLRGDEYPPQGMDPSTGRMPQDDFTDGW
jgi:hypothetical protein